MRRVKIALFGDHIILVCFPLSLSHGTNLQKMSELEPLLNLDPHITLCLDNQAMCIALKSIYFMSVSYCKKYVRHMNI